jgi:hypothetical protein
MMKRLRGCHSDTTTPTTARICWNIFQLLLPDKDMVILIGIVREYVCICNIPADKTRAYSGHGKITPIKCVCLCVTLILVIDQQSSSSS